MLEEILEKVQNEGMEIDEFQIDGKWHRFKWQDELNKKASYRVLETPYALNFIFNHWKNVSKKKTLVLEKKELTPEELELHTAKIKELEISQKEKQALQWEAARKRSEEIWALSKETLRHSYLLKKELKSNYGARVHPLGSLYIPARDLEGVLWGLQGISADGDKSNVKNCRMKGCFHFIGDFNPEGELHLFEGYATSATFFELTGLCVASCFSSYFFQEAGQLLLEKYPHLKIVFCGDADAVGRNYAQKAAVHFKQNYLIPNFKSPHPDLTDWNDLQNLEGKSFAMAQIHELKQSGKEAKQTWLAETLREAEFKVSYNGMIEWEGVLGTSPGYVSNELFLRSRQKFIPCDKTLINSYLENRIKNEQEAVYQSIVENLFKTPTESKGEIEKFLNAVIQSPTEEDFWVLSHFLWQIKRKALDMKVERHLMPVICGKTDGGKSEAVRKLLAPLQELSIEQEMSIFNDQRHHSLFHKHLVIFMDEMSKAEKVDVAAMKRVISAETLNFRVLGTHLHHSGVNRSTCIGTTNEVLEMLIKDATSVRRFYALNSRDLCDWDAVNSIDYSNLWKSIDAKNPSLLMKNWAKIKAVQETFRSKSDVENWVEDLGAIYSQNHAAKAHDLFVKFCTFNEKMGNFKWNVTRFGLEMKRLGFKSIKKKSGWVYPLFYEGMTDYSI